MEESITEVMTGLVLQLAVIIFAVRVFGKLAKKIGIPSVLGELIAGIVIGPFALGGLPLPGFPNGLFLVHPGSTVSPELYSISTIASIILLFASGLETDLKLFLKYSFSGGIIGFGGVAVSFILGDVSAMLMMHTGFMDIPSLFFGIMSTATSVGITARILSDEKKMDSPEGVTILAAAVFDDVLGIVLLAIVMGIVSAMSGGSSLSGGAIGVIAVKAFSIWLVVTALCIIFSKKIAGFVKLFGSSFDFSICALGVALFLAGVFEKQGLAMIIGAYTMGLALSSTDIAPVIQERIHGIYELFVPVFFAVSGMMVNVGALMNKEVLIFGAIYTVIAVLAKIIGCGGPALAFGFNSKGALRIGAGMIPRGEVALIIAGIGMTSGIFALKIPGCPYDAQQLFGVVIMMTLVTTLVAPPLLNIFLRMKGRGTRKDVKTSSAQEFVWDFNDDEIADLVIDMLLKDLRGEGFYVQMMNINDGLSQARKGDVSLSITENESIVSIQTAEEDMGFVKASMYEVILRLNKSIRSLESLHDSEKLKACMDTTCSRFDRATVKILSKDTVSCDLKATTKDEVLTEMVTLLSNSRKVHNSKRVLEDIKERESIMTTGLERGLAIPHAKTNGVDSICIAIGISKAGIEFGAPDGNRSNLFVMVASPKKNASPHLQTLAAISGALRSEKVLNSVINATEPQQVVDILDSVCNNSK
ncbi:MAG: sodium:proton exchanger [Treponema sp. CETP13]|nr:MAG: sodium:proton exchanger [Treponema sp. CETP13]